MVIYTIYRVSRGRASRYASCVYRFKAQERADFLNKGIPGSCKFHYVVIPEFVDDSAC